MRYDVAIVDQDPTGTELAEHLNNMASKGWTLDKLIALPKPGGTVDLLVAMAKEDKPDKPPYNPIIEVDLGDPTGLSNTLYLAMESRKSQTVYHSVYQNCCGNLMRVRVLAFRGRFIWMPEAGRYSTRASIPCGRIVAAPREVSHPLPA